MSKYLASIQPVSFEGAQQERSFGEFAPVSVNEMAFALSFFVHTANGQIASKPPVRPCGEGEMVPDGCREVLQAFSPPRRTVFDASPVDGPCECSLDRTFLTLWRHYDGDARQPSICARVLWFYSLMERSRGAAVERWTKSCEEDPEAVTLHPAVVYTVATVPLHGEEFVSDALFLEMLEVNALHSAD